MQSLRALAGHIDAPERTLRRAAAEGLIHGQRLSERRFRTTMREEAYLRGHWRFLRELRDALRTERNVRLAVLFGSFATGSETDGSDIDIWVTLADRSAGRMAELSGRLERRLGRPVQLVRAQEAAGSPALMADVLEDGRVLVDRDDRWRRLRSERASWRRRASAEDVPLLRAMTELDPP